MCKKKGQVVEKSSTPKEEYLKAFDGLNQELEEVRKEIFKIINDFLLDYYDRNKLDHEVDFVLFEPTSRVKGRKSFEEKIVRKNYVKTWKVKNNDYGLTILENLDDIIGFRINCYFKKDEQNIYRDIIDFAEANPLLEVKEYGTKSKRKIEKNEIDKIEELIDVQGNGEPIYKMVLRYKSENHNSNVYPFELQIKSLVHNLWGEVDHEIAYKAKQYDYNFEQKKIITKAIFETLKASDTQLLNLYRTNYDEMNLINSLFFLYTQDEVKNALKGKNPTFYYHKFFSIFNDGKTTSLLKKFVSLKMTNNNSFEKENFDFHCEEKELWTTFNKLLNENELYDSNRCNEIKEIASVLYKFDDKDSSFLDHLYPVLRNKISKTSIVNEAPEENLEEDEEDEDNVDFIDTDKENAVLPLEKIFEEDLINPGKEAFYDLVKNRKDCDSYGKELLCRVFFNLYDI